MKHKWLGWLAVGAVTLLLVGFRPLPLFAVPGDGGLPGEPAQTTLDRYWQHAREEVDRSVMELIAQHQTELVHGIAYHKLLRGNPKRKWIALTFDDGPHPAYTPQLLAILKQYNAKATFFVVGEMAEKYPDLVRAEIAAGHNVGNHTFHHVNLTKIPPADAAVELKACGEVLKGITGKAPHLFRPPGGDYDKDVIIDAEALGYTTVLWTDDPGDYASPGAKVIQQRLLRDINNGGIVLIHDGIQQTIDVLPQILTYLQKQGYQFVTIDEMLKDPVNPVAKMDAAKPSTHNASTLVRHGATASQHK